MTETVRDPSHCNGGPAYMSRNVVDSHGRSRPVTRSARLARDTASLILPLVTMMCACGNASRSAAASTKPVQSETAALADAPAEAPGPGMRAFGESAPEALLGMLVSATPRAHVQEIIDFTAAIELDLSGQLAPDPEIEAILAGWEDSPLAGLDIRKPFYILLVDAAASPELVFIPAIRDPKLVDELVALAGEGAPTLAIRHANGYAAISSSQAAVELVGDYALGDLLAESLPEELAIVARMPAVMRRYGRDLPMLLDTVTMSLLPEMVGQARQHLLEPLERVARESRLAWMLMDLGPEHISIRLMVEADPESDLARFMRAQRPSDFAAARGFAVAGDLGVIAGELQHAGSSLSIPALMTMFMPSIQGAPPAHGELRKTWHALTKLSSGAGAMVFFTDASGTLQLGVRNPIRDSARARELLKTFIQPTGSPPDGASREMRIDDDPVYLVKMRPPELAGQLATAVLPRFGTDFRLAAAVADEHLWFLFGSGSEQLIQRALGGAMRTDVDHPAITQARRHGESLVIHVDGAICAASIQPPSNQGIAARPGTSGISLGAGFRDVTGWLRLDIPTDLARGMRTGTGEDPVVSEPADRPTKPLAGPAHGDSDKTQEERRREEAAPQPSCLSAKNIREHMRKELPRFRECYETELRKKPELAGTLRIEFLISPEGTVTYATAQGVSDEVASCVADVVKTIQFPRSCDGGPTRVTYPLIFRPTGG